MGIKLDEWTIMTDDFWAWILNVDYEGELLDWVFSGNFRVIYFQLQFFNAGYNLMIMNI